MAEIKTSNYDIEVGPSLPSHIILTPKNGSVRIEITFCGEAQERIELHTDDNVENFDGIAYMKKGKDFSTFRLVKINDNGQFINDNPDHKALEASDCLNIK